MKLSKESSGIRKVSYLPTDYSVLVKHISRENLNSRERGNQLVANYYLLDLKKAFDVTLNINLRGPL
mgnify:CR=1 FL=1